MKCDKVRDLLLTEYADGMLSKEMKKGVVSHLATCPACRKYASTVQKAAIDPFHAVDESKPPERVWEHLRQKIAAEEDRRLVPGVINGIVQSLWNALHTAPGLAATASVVGAITAGLVFGSIHMGKKKMINDYLQEQIEFLGTADTAIGAEDDDILQDWETAQESLL